MVSAASDKMLTSLRAAVEFVEAPVRNCILTAGSLPGVRGCGRVGMLCIVLQNILQPGPRFPRPVPS
ncbi:hypothetical protein MLD38_038591 [Melastoma candidum]|uniref:Uncharacterized protein n=1 Tax=Melastoma candidum TaxID=119954 RepID=A0ACB9L024_9MYRT|nr:hypothetical protein MLD38_038591 [Melastoma candidum]